MVKLAFVSWKRAFIVDTYRPLWNIPDLLPHELLKLVCALSIGCGLIIVASAIVEYQHGVLDEILWGRVQVLLMLLFHGRQIHGLHDYLVVVWNLIAVDGLGKWPGCTMVLHIVQQVQQLVIVGPMAWLTSHFIHIW